jgi:hypothetical protein
MRDYKYVMYRQERLQTRKPIFYQPSKLAAIADCIGVAVVMASLYVLLMLVAA